MLNSRASSVCVLDMFGLSDHDLMFSREAHTQEETKEEMAAGYVESRVGAEHQGPRASCFTFPQNGKAVAFIFANSGHHC